MGALIGAALAALLNVAGPQFLSSAEGDGSVDVTISRQKPTMTVSLINTPSTLPPVSLSSSTSASSSSSTTTTTTTTTTVVTTMTQPKPTTTTNPPTPTTTTTTKRCGLIFC